MTSSSIRRQHSFHHSEPRLEIEASIAGRIQRIEIPQYALRYPNFDRVSLPVVKQGIQHPQLPSVYKYRIDDFNNKPPIENARSSTNLTAYSFIQNNQDKRPQSCASEAICLHGDIQSSAQTFLDKARSQSASPGLIAKLTNESTYKPVNCVMGREHFIKMPEDKTERVFRFNRVRQIIPDRPMQGHKECYFDTTPAIDKFGRRVEAATYAKYRDTNPIEVKSKEPFKPYGHTTAHYTNYIMYYPRM